MKISPLKAAAYQGHNADVNATDEYGRTPLHWAAKKGHLDIATELIAHNADINATDEYGKTPLFWAAYQGHLNILKQLIAHKADVNAADKYGRTPLRAAAYRRHREIVKELIAHNADVNATHEYGWAAENDHLEKVKELIKHNADVNATNKKIKDELRNYQRRKILVVKQILWKNIIIRKRHRLLTIFEITIPILLVFVLLGCWRAFTNDGIHRISNVSGVFFYDKESEYEIYNHVPNNSSKIFYSPNTSRYNKIMSYVQIRFNIAKENMAGFRSELKFEDFYDNFNADGLTLVAVMFKGDDPKHLDYDLRIYERNLTWNTEKLCQPSSIATIANNSDYFGSSKYVRKGFVGLQMALDIAFIETTGNFKILNASFAVQQFQNPPRVEISKSSKLSTHFLALTTIFSFIWLCTSVLKLILKEKESGVWELMKICGLKSWILWLGWFIYGCSSNIVVIIVNVLSLKFLMHDVIEYCHWSILFVFLLLYCMTSIIFIFFLSAIFTKPMAGMVNGILICILSYYPAILDVNLKETLHWKYKIVMGIFPNVALHFGYSAIQVYESSEVGIRWSNFHIPGNGGENEVTMMDVFVMYLVDMLIYMLLTIYINNINPGKYGVSKSFFYPIKLLPELSHKLWHKIFSSTITNSRGELDTLLINTNDISFKSVTKVYDNTTVLKELSLDFSTNEITVLLGTGKTTVISLLTGMTDITRGTIEVDGQDLRWGLDEVRKRIGFCPQQNWLFPDLTAIEHLKFFAIVKGKSWTDADKEVNKQLQRVGLDVVKNDLPHQLSNDNKRKLSLAIALIGDPQILLLDEPTSGMNFTDRIATWKLFKELKKERIILLTTHDICEAYALADRICMLDQGRLQFCDAPDVLKNQDDACYRSLMMSETGVEQISHNDEQCILTITNDDTREEETNDNASEDIDLVEKGEINHSILNYRARKGASFRIVRALGNYWHLCIPVVIFILIIVLEVLFIVAQSNNEYIDLDLYKNYGKSTVYFSGSNLASTYYERVVSSQNGYPVETINVSQSIINRATNNTSDQTQMIVAAEFGIGGDKDRPDFLSVNCLYSANAIHSAPISVNLCTNSIAKLYLGDDYSITTRNRPI